MALELVKLDSETLPGIADAIRAKTGDTALLRPSEMAAAIAGIPTGGDLPELTKPAAEKDVLAGKEYIDGSGAKKTGTLVVCDTVQEAGIVRNPGTGLEVDLQSTADGSDKTLTLPEPNLLPENIKSGVSIFGILGSANALKSASGTFTLSEDAQAPEITHNLGVIPDLVIVEAEDYDNTENSILGFVAVRAGLLSCTLLSNTLFGGTILIINAMGAESNGSANVNGKAAFDRGLSDTGFVCAYNNNYKYRAGWTYRWKVFAGLA